LCKSQNLRWCTLNIADISYFRLQRVVAFLVDFGRFRAPATDFDRRVLDRLKFIGQPNQAAKRQSFLASALMIFRDFGVAAAMPLILSMA
jgi:hypothetical protein